LEEYLMPDDEAQDALDRERQLREREQAVRERDRHERVPDRTADPLEDDEERKPAPPGPEAQQPRG
jgi:hypothetical protein